MTRSSTRQERRRVAEVLEHDSAPLARSSTDAERCRSRRRRARHRPRGRTRRRAACRRRRRSSAGAIASQAARPRPLERERHQRIPIRGIVAERAAPEVAPQIEVLELDARARSKLPVSSARNTSSARASVSSSARMPASPPSRPSPGCSDLLAAGCRTYASRSRANRSSSSVVADRAQRVVQDDPVGPAGDRNAVERVGVADDLLAGAVHRPDAGAAGQDERAVDVEEHEFRSWS